MIKFSIIIPFYNVEPYIEECLRSIYNQDIPIEEYEVICVNDCSPDNSVGIIKQLQKDFSNIVLIEHSKNKKLGGARNTGLKNAKGKYIWFVDSDDMVMPNILGLTYKILAKDNLDMIHFGYNEYVFNKLKINEPIETTNITDGISLFLDNRFVWWKNHITAWCKIYKREFLIENKLFFEENIMYEDNDFAFRVFSIAKRVRHISDNLYIYRNNPNSITKDRYTDKHILYWLKVAKISIHLRDTLEKENINQKFLTIIDEDIRDSLYQILKAYKILDKESKKRAKLNIMQEITQSFRKYLSYINYWKMRIGII